MTDNKITLRDKLALLYMTEQWDYFSSQTLPEVAYNFADTAIEARGAKQEADQEPEAQKRRAIWILAKFTTLTPDELEYILDCTNKGYLPNLEEVKNNVRV